MSEYDDLKDLVVLAMFARDEASRKLAAYVKDTVDDPVACGLADALLAADSQILQLRRRLVNA